MTSCRINRKEECVHIQISVGFLFRPSCFCVRDAETPHHHHPTLHYYSTLICTHVCSSHAHNWTHIPPADRLSRHALASFLQALCFSLSAIAPGGRREGLQCGTDSKNLINRTKNNGRVIKRRAFTIKNVLLTVIPSIHLLHFSVTEVEERNPNLPLPSDTFQLVLGDPEMFPCQRKYIIPLATSRSSPGPPSSGMCPENL